MEKTPLEIFKEKCIEYLSKRPSLGDLRVYGRKLGVKEPTKKKKEDLIVYIVDVLTGGITPIERSHRGAPVKNEYFDPEIERTVEELRAKYLRDYKQELYKPNTVIEFASPNRAELEESNVYKDEIYSGQLEFLGGAYRLLPTSCFKVEKHLIMPDILVEKHGLREGDVVSCRANQTENGLVAKDVLTINGSMVESYSRIRFEEGAVCYPYEPIRVYEPQRFDGFINKYIAWLTPLGKGQRGCVVSKPKAGKTSFITKTIEAINDLNSHLTILVLAVGQPPETIAELRKTVKEENFVYTGYEDEPEKQVFGADFIIKRAKRLAESGRDVLLVVDSFNALARAYNDCDVSSGGKTLSCGLESKTVQYLKKYFASARCFETGGSLTILGAVSEDTGNPADDYLSAELKMLCNYELALDVTLASRGIFPAISGGKTSLQPALVERFDERERVALGRAKSKSEFLQIVKG